MQSSSLTSKEAVFSRSFVVWMPMTMYMNLELTITPYFACFFKAPFVTMWWWVANKAQQLNANHALVVFSHSLDSRSCIYSRPSFFLSALLLCCCLVLNPITFLCFAPAFAFVYVCQKSKSSSLLGEQKRRCEHGKSREYDCCSRSSQVGPIPQNDFILDICQSWQ